MASFDLSYIKFADKKKIPCLHFVLPVLRDKLPSDIDVSKLEILSLSQDEKLFKI